MRNALPDAHVDSLKLGRQKPPMPFSDVNLLGNLLHTFWFLPSVASCDAMENLLKQRQNMFIKIIKLSMRQVQRQVLVVKLFHLLSEQWVKIHWQAKV